MPSPRARSGTATSIPACARCSPATFRVARRYAPRRSRGPASWSRSWRWPRSASTTPSSACCTTWPSTSSAGSEPALLDHSAAGLDVLAGHPPGRLAREERRHAGHFLGRADAVEGRQGRGVAPDLVAVQHLRVGEARREDVDGHVARPQLARERPRELLDRALAAEIEPGVGHVHPSATAGDDDDAAAVADATARLA